MKQTVVPFRDKQYGLQVWKTKQNVTPSIVVSVCRKSTCPPNGEHGPCHPHVPGIGNSSDQETELFGKCCYILKEQRMWTAKATSEKPAINFI